MTIPPDMADKLRTHVEVSSRYMHVQPVEQCMALIAVRLFMDRFGYEQTLSLLKQHGEDMIAAAIQKELADLAKMWRHAMKLEPPDPDQFDRIANDVNIVADHATDGNTQARIYRIIARLRLREDMIQQRTKVHGG